MLYNSILSIAALALSATAFEVSAPGPGQVFQVGTPIEIQWTVDATKDTAKWGKCQIDLMTGPNQNQVNLGPVATNFDCTTAASLQYTAPAVNPYSAIYFFMFTPKGAAAKASDTQWTTRFAISDPSGQTTPPANANSPGTTDGIAWGTGALGGSNIAVPAGASSISSLPVSSSSLPLSSSLPSTMMSITSLPATTSVPATSTAVPTTSMSNNGTSSSQNSGSASHGASIAIALFAAIAVIAL